MSQTPTKAKPWFVEGLRRLAAGERVQFSTGIDGRMSYGYGVLDDHGFWQHPVPFDSLSEAQQKVVVDHDSKAECSFAWPAPPALLRERSVDGWALCNYQRNKKGLPPLENK